MTKGSPTQKCLIELRDLPLERFRLTKDGRKWGSAARSRRMVLEFIASFANSDGTVGKFSPSVERQRKHSGFSSRWILHIHDELRDLGFLDWSRVRHQRKHYVVTIPDDLTKAGEVTSSCAQGKAGEVASSCEQVNYSSEQVKSRVHVAGEVQSSPIRPLPSKESVILPSPENRTAMTEDNSWLTVEKSNPAQDRQKISGKENKSESSTGSLEANGSHTRSIQVQSDKGVAELGAAFAKITGKPLKPRREHVEFLQRQIADLGYDMAESVVEAFARDAEQDFDRIKYPAAILKRDWDGYKAQVDSYYRQMAEIERAKKQIAEDSARLKAELAAKLAEKRAEEERWRDSL